MARLFRQNVLRGAASLDEVLTTIASAEEVKDAEVVKIIIDNESDLRDLLRFALRELRTEIFKDP